jgi:hypothetical protein
MPHMMVALVCPPLNYSAFLISHHTLSERYRVRIFPACFLLLVSSTAIMAQDVFVILRIIAMP